MTPARQPTKRHMVLLGCGKLLNTLSGTDPFSKVLEGWMEEEEELLLLLDILLQHALLDEEENEIAADQQLHEQLLDFEFFDELQLDDAHE